MYSPRRTASINIQIENAKNSSATGELNKNFKDPKSVRLLKSDPNMDAEATKGCCCPQPALKDLTIIFSISCYLMLPMYAFYCMNISLGKQLEKLVQQQVKTGIYQNNSEVVRDALRHMFLEDDSDDTELLAQSLRAARNSPRKRYMRGEFQKLVARAVAIRRGQAKAA